MIQWWHIVSQRWKWQSFLLKSRIQRLVINPLVGFSKSSFDQPLLILTRSALGAGSWVCKPGVPKCQAEPIYTLTSVSEMGLSSATPSPYLVAHCPIDNSQSMNGMTRIGDSQADICACSPCMEGTGEGTETMTGLLLIFPVPINHCNITEKPHYNRVRPTLMNEYNTF